MPGGPCSARFAAVVVALAATPWARALAEEPAPGAPPVEPPAAEPTAADPAAPAFTFQGRLEWISAAAAAAPRDTAVNPRNAALALPAGLAQTELRPDLRVEYGSELQAVARPRLLVEASKARVAGEWRAERSDASASWIDLYATWRVDDRLQVSYGRQNFQWGPGELVGPSNRIFHETGFARDPLYLVRGKELARVNLSRGAEWSAVILAEVASNGDAPFVAGEPFEPKGQAKLEWAAPSGRGWAGVTAGAGRRSRGFFGEYAALTVVEGLSLYADAVHQAGTRAWYPVDLGPAGAIFAQDATGAGLRTLALGGVRYTFEGGTDVRLEYAFDEAGWTASELALAARAAAASPLLVPAWLAPGFELVGREHAYASVLVPDLPPAERTRVQLRYLASLTDRSGAAFATASYDASDSAVAFVSALWTHGDDDGALSRLAVAGVTAGVVVTW